MEEPIQFIKYQGVEYPVSVLQAKQIAEGYEEFHKKYGERLKQAMELEIKAPADHTYLDQILGFRRKAAILCVENPTEFNLKRYFYFEQCLKSALHIIDE